MLLKNLRIVTSTTLNDQTQNIRITDGLIAEIGPKLRAQDGEQVHDFQGAYVSPGWMDMHVHFWNTMENQVCTQYFNSVYMGKARAIYILQ